MFLDNKYTNWYNKIIARARTRALDRAVYHEVHHVIPESFYINRARKGSSGWLIGNPESVENKVILTAHEHFICHLLLPKMLTGQGKAKMIYALWGMTTLKNKNQPRYRVTGRIYQAIKTMWSNREISAETRQKISSGNKGKKAPPSFRKKVDNYWTEENRKIHAEKISKITKGRKLSEETKEKYRNKKWSDKAIQSRLNNCLQSAAARKGKTWSGNKRKSMEDTYFSKNLSLAITVMRLRDAGLNISAIAKKTEVDWGTVNTIIKRRAEFERRISNI